eukprot:COSAG01_NODE_4482_length_4984_cov_4.097851_3_plen_339_part_00
MYMYTVPRRRVGAREPHRGGALVRSAPRARAQLLFRLLYHRSIPAERPHLPKWTTFAIMAEETLLVPQTKPTYQCAALAELATAIDRAGVEVKTLKTKADPTDDEVKLLKLFGETPAGYTEDVNPMMCCWGMSGWFGEPRVPGQKAKDGGCCGCGGSTNANFYESFMAVLAGKDASGGGMNGCYGCCCLEPQRWEGETPIWKDDQNKQTLFQCLLGRPGILPQLYMKKGAKCYGPPFYCFVCPTGDTNPKVAKAYPGLVPIPDAFQWCGFIPAMCYGNQYGKYVPYAPYAPWDDWPVCCTNGCLLVHTNVPCCKCPKCPMCPVCPKIGVPGCPTIKLP